MRAVYILQAGEHWCLRWGGVGDRQERSLWKDTLPTPEPSGWRSIQEETPRAAAQPEFTRNNHHAQAIISRPSTGPQDAQRPEKGSQFSLKGSLWGHLYVERSPKEENIVYQERIY